MSHLAELYRRYAELNEAFYEADWFQAEEIQKEIDVVSLEIREAQRAVLEDPFQAFANSGFSSPLQIDYSTFETKGT